MIGGASTGWPYLYAYKDAAAVLRCAVCHGSLENHGTRPCETVAGTADTGPITLTLLAQTCDFCGSHVPQDLPHVCAPALVPEPRNRAERRERARAEGRLWR